jgi:hypothetical protein
VSNPVITRDRVTDVHAAFVADPFMVRVERAWFMFFEVMAWRRGGKKGEIGLATSTDGFEWAYQGIVLSEPFHLSYPYVFADGREHYMIPESSAASSIRLYRASPFPERWVHVADLLTGGSFLDSSVFEHDGRWWMLTDASDLGKHDTLRLFQADRITGPWTEHPQSPVVAGNPRIARPAGRVVATRGRLLRFAQDCRSAYGSSVRALEIRRLDARGYEDAELADAPVLAGSGHGWNRLGMHQLDAHQLEDGSWIACVDGWKTRLRTPREVIRWAASRWA